MKKLVWTAGLSLFVFLSMYQTNAQALPFCSSKWVPHACKCRAGVWRTKRSFHKTSLVKFTYHTYYSLRAKASKELKKECRKFGQIKKWSRKSVGPVKHYKKKGRFHYHFTLQVRCQWEKKLQQKKNPTVHNGHTTVKYAHGTTKTQGTQGDKKPIKPSLVNKLCKRNKRKTTNKLKAKYKKNYISHTYTSSCTCKKGLAIETSTGTMRFVVCKRNWKVKYQVNYKPRLYRCVP